MPISSNNLLDWVDIQAIYTNLNRAKSNFSQTQVPIPNAENNIILTSHLSTLVSQIQAMSSIPKIGSNANVGVTIPSPGDIIYPFEFSRAATTAQTIANICNFNAAFHTSCFGFNSFDSYDDFDSSFDSYDDFDRSFDSHRDFDSGNRSFDGFRANNFDSGFDDFDRNIDRGSDG